MGHSYTEMVDAAQELQMSTNDKAVAAIQALAGPETHPDFDGKHCVDGGEVIPEARLSLGKIRCVNCQEAVERGSKLYRR